MSFKKILIFGLSTLLLALTALVGLVFLLNLGTVDINYISTLNNLDGSNQEIIDSGQFNFNESILFIDKQHHVRKLEAENPYIRILSIESVFPNKLVIHAVEREPLFFFQEQSDKYIILDEHLKILEIKDSITNSQLNPIELIDFNIGGDPVFEGQFMFSDDLVFRRMITDFSLELQKWDNNLVNVKANIKEINFIDALENRVDIQTWQGVNIYIFDINDNIEIKVHAAFSLFDSDSIDRYSGEIRVLVSEDTGDLDVRYIE